MEIIGSGAQSDIFKDNGKAIKLFKYNIQKKEVEQEFNMQKMAYDYGLPVPEAYGVIEIDNKYGILMEYIEGVTLGKIIQDDFSDSNENFLKSIEMQNSIHKIETGDFPNQKNKLKSYIANAGILKSGEKEKLLNKLEAMKFKNMLCHGDYHINNLIKTSNNILVIDWSCASSGNPEADICRTYLLYKIYAEVMANIYLDYYCRITNIEKSVILEWEPIIAGARLGESTIDEEKEKLMEIIANV